MRVRLFFFAGKTVFDHISADKAQEYKRHPVVQMLYFLGKISPGKKTDERHKRLKEAEINAGEQNLNDGRFFFRQA